MQTFFMVTLLVIASFTSRMVSSAPSSSSFNVIEDSLEQHLVLSGPVASQVSEKVTVRWYSMVKKLQVEKGQKVKTGDPIAEMDAQYLKYNLNYYNSYYQQQKNNYEQAVLNEKYQKDKLERQRGLAEKGIIGNDEKEKAEVEKLQARIAVIQKETEIKKSERAINELKEQIDSVSYRAPIDGVVTRLVIDPKQVVGSFLVQANDTLVQIEQPGKYVVKAYTYDVMAAQILTGSDVKVFIWDSSKPFQGKISLIQQEEKKVGEGKQILFKVEVKFDFEGELLPEGVLATLQIPLKTHEKQLLVPWNAIQTDIKGKTTVQVADGKGAWVTREVVLGERGKDRVSIKEGLSLGEKIRVLSWPS